MKDKSLRQSFDQTANLYAKVRSGYPQEIIERTIALSQLEKSSRILEVGVGTGQITLPFAERGFEMVGLELGENLAQQARYYLQAYPKVSIVQADFEHWQSSKPFDLLLSAQAFHWIDVERGLEQASNFLKPSGTLALVWTFDESEHTDSYKAMTPVFEKYIPDIPDRPTPQKGYKSYKGALEHHPDFSNLVEHHVQWDRTYSKNDYLDLHDTFSNHRAVSEETRVLFRKELSEVIDSFGGSVLRHHKTVLLSSKRS